MNSNPGEDITASYDCDMRKQPGLCHVCTNRKRYIGRSDFTYCPTCENPDGTPKTYDPFGPDDQMPAGVDPLALRLNAQHVQAQMERDAYQHEIDKERSE